MRVPLFSRCLWDTGHIFQMLVSVTSLCLHCYLLEKDYALLFIYHYIKTLGDASNGVKNINNEVLGFFLFCFVLKNTRWLLGIMIHVDCKPESSLAV